MCRYCTKCEWTGFAESSNISIFMCWNKLFTFLSSSKEEERLRSGSRCCGKLVLTSPGRECAAISNLSQKQLFQVTLWRTAHFPLHHQLQHHQHSFSYLRALGEQRSIGQKTDSSISRPITCHCVTQVMHLGRLAEPWGYFFSVLSIHNQNYLKYHWVPLRLGAPPTFDLKGQVTN